MRQWFKQKRWAFYALLGFAVIFVFVLAALVSLGAYRDWLIRTYTVAFPERLAAESNPAEFAVLKARWEAFVKDLSDDADYPQPLGLSATELNQFINHVPGLSNKLRLEIDGDVLKGDFSFPIGKAEESRFQGRFINGQATFALAFDLGFPTLTVATVEANSRPLPKWLLKKVQRKNFIEQLDRDYRARQLLNRLEKVEVHDSQLWLVPQNGEQ
jgi:hypothetical protein